MFSKLLKKVRHNHESLPSMRNAYLSAYLKADGHTVSYHKNTVDTELDVLFLQPTLIRHNEEILLLKKIFTNKVRPKNIILFGPLVEANICNWLDFSDTIIIGDIENYFNIKKSFLETGTINVGKLKKLDGLLFPDWSLYGKQVFKQFPLLRKVPTYLVQASRSCPYKCSYCPYIINDTTFLKRPVAEVIEEIVSNITQYGAKSILFRDPVFGLDKKWLEDFCSELINKNINIEWGIETRIDVLTLENISMMKKAGLVLVKLGIESSDIGILNQNKRRSAPKNHQQKIINCLNELKIKSVGFYVLGLLEDTEKTINNTINYSIELNTTYANYTICTPLPGTEFYEKVKHQIVEKNYQKFDNFHLTYEHPTLSSKKLYELQSQAFKTFYFNRKKIITQIKGLFNA